MSGETVQAICAAVVTLAQLYYLEAWHLPLFAMFWDWLARFCSRLSWLSGWWAMKARENYYVTVSAQ